MGLKGNLSTVRGLKSTLRAMPITMAADVARRAAPAMTEETKTAFATGRSVYGEPRPAGVDGAPLTLRRTGAVERDLRFVAIGTITRCVLGPRYSKYLIGKYGVLPNGPLPAGWVVRLGKIVAETRPRL